MSFFGTHLPRVEPLFLQQLSSGTAAFFGLSHSTVLHTPVGWPFAGLKHGRQRSVAVHASCCRMSTCSATSLKTVEKQRYVTSVAPMAANPGKWVEMPRLPIPTGEHAVIECNGKIHVIAGYAKHRVDGNFHQVYDSKSKTWELKAPFPIPCNHVAGCSLNGKVYTFGGFIEQNRCPHSKCFVYDPATDT